MISPYVYVPLVVAPLAAALLVAAKRSLTPHSHRALAVHTRALQVPAYLRLWAAIVLLSALEAVILRIAGRSVFGPAYVGANFCAVLVLLLLAASFSKSLPAVPLLHLFANVACALYLRVACWLLFTGSAS